MRSVCLSFRLSSSWGHGSSSSVDTARPRQTFYKVNYGAETFYGALKPDVEHADCLKDTLRVQKHAIHRD
ncbi:hypothetical protein KP509_09G082700 [Ceratopteris richardii]|uniref:Uncharacterized protein n=1 Tax=Ceratopteris richardii TaxID=49495 RepID=A0A8T2U469_CERRI|nr:hypothetical protein KP509_09G082700 [Ceratopteris richardii]